MNNAPRTKENVEKIYVGEAYIKKEENLMGEVIEHVAVCRDLYISDKEAAEYYEGLCKSTSKARKTLDDTVNVLDRFSWRDPSLSTVAVQHTKAFIREIFEHVRTNSEVDFPVDVDLIETGSFFSNLRVGLPYEFDFMIDLTSILPVGFTVGVADVPKERFFFPYGKDGSIPTLKENIYYYISAPIESNEFVEPTDFGMLFHVKRFCESLYAAFGDAVESLRDEWNIFDYTPPKTSPAFSCSMFFENPDVFYEDTGIMIDLVPCFKFPVDQKHILPPVNTKMNEYFTTILTGNPKGHVYDMLPLYLVCYDTEKDDYPFREYTFRLSTSLFEKCFYTHLDPKVAAALRVFRYFYQTFPSGNGGIQGVWQKKLNRVNLTAEYESTLNQSVEKIFGCKNHISSYFFTNFMLKLLSTGQLIAKFKTCSLGEIFSHFLSYKLQLMQTIPSEEVLASSGVHYVSVGSWFFEDRTFASKTISLEEDKIFGMLSWLRGVAGIVSDDMTTHFLDQYFPLTCIVPEGPCCSCTGVSFNERLVTHEPGKPQCGVHQMVLFVDATFPTFGPFDSNIFFAEIQRKGMTVTGS